MDENKIMFLDEKTIINLQYYMPKNSVLQQMANFFSIFSDETRLKILSALSISKMCVNDISTSLSLNQTTVSHQLRFLKSAGIVRCNRQGKIVFYALTNEAVTDVILKGIEFLGC